MRGCRGAARRTHAWSCVGSTARRTSTASNNHTLSVLTSLRQLRDPRQWRAQTPFLYSLRAASSSSISSGTSPGTSTRAESSAALDHLPHAVTPTSAAPSAVASDGAASSSTSETMQSSERNRVPRASARVGASAIGKSKHGTGSGNTLRVKKKAPWGVQQLRDSWSEDAMSKRDRENMDERIHREYRYHPDEVRRHYIRYTAFLTIPCVMMGMSITYYRETGRPIWTADPQHLLNLLRVMDTSPRSKLYAYRMEDAEGLPKHVLEYRQHHAEQRVYDERVFKLTHSAFERPSEDALRRLELDEQLKAEADAAAGVSSDEE